MRWWVNKGALIGPVPQPAMMVMYRYGSFFSVPPQLGHRFISYWHTMFVG